MTGKPTIGMRYLVRSGNFRGLIGDCQEVRKTPGCYRALLSFGVVSHWIEDYRIDPLVETEKA
jgi:hypothetical protein